MENAKRNFVKLITEICEEQGLSLTSYSFDWIFSVERPGGKRGFLTGYQFGLNPASVALLCCDKSAASEVMTSLGIPNVEHHFFMSPANRKFAAKTGDWERMLGLLKKYGILVCKDNDGTGGNLVFTARTPYELEGAAYRIFGESKSMAISPYCEIEKEYRVIVLNGDIRLVYYKQRPSVTGDGVKTLAELIAARSPERLSCSELPLPLAFVPADGEEVLLNWRHNLGQGARAVVERNAPGKLLDVVNEVIKKLGVRFASVDVVRCKEEYKVLEINSGVMLEAFSAQDESSYETAKGIYRDAILAMLEE